MSKYKQLKAKNLPHVFVRYTRGETRAEDQYAYGVVGIMPMAQLVGYIIRVQAELAFRNPDPCDDCACVIIYNPETGKMQWFVDSSIPVDPLAGTLELIKCMLVDNQMASMFQAAQERAATGLVDPAGKPILKGK